MAPLARGEQSDPRTAENADCSGFAARPMESRGLCSWGPHLRWGKERKLRQRDLRSITGRRSAGPGVPGDRWGGPPKHLSFGDPSSIRETFTEGKTCRLMLSRPLLPKKTAIFRRGENYAHEWQWRSRVSAHLRGGGPPFWKGGNKGSQASTTTTK